MREHPHITQAQLTNKNPEPLPKGGQVTASRYGKKYYAPWCGGANRISPRNKIWFKDENTAKQAGYTPAGNCKGLK